MKNFPRVDSIKSAAAVGTPFYLYDQEGILSSLKDLSRCFGDDSSYCNYLLMNENSNPGILQLMRNAGCGVIVGNYDELVLAQQCGFVGSKLIFHPGFDDDAARKLALELDAVWLIDNLKAIPTEPVSRVLLRFYPECPTRGPLKYSLYNKLYCGLTRRQLIDAVRLFAARQTPSIGVECFLPVVGAPAGFYAAKAELLLDLIAEIYLRTDVCIDVCHLGNLPYSDSYPLEEDAAKIVQSRNALPEPLHPAIHTRLGNWALMDHGALIAKVLDIREYSRKYVMLDGSALHFLRPTMQGASLRIRTVRDPGDKPLSVYRIYGPESEFFGCLQRKCLLPSDLAPGELCVIPRVGCSSQSMPVLHAMRTIPASWLQKPDGEVVLLTQSHDGVKIRNFLTTW